MFDIVARICASRLCTYRHSHNFRHPQRKLTLLSDKYQQLANYADPVPTYYAAVHRTIRQRFLIFNFDYKSTFTRPWRASWASSQRGATSLQVSLSQPAALQGATRPSPGRRGGHEKIVSVFAVTFVSLHPRPNQI